MLYRAAGIKSAVSCVLNCVARAPRIWLVFIACDWHVLDPPPDLGKCWCLTPEPELWRCSDTQSVAHGQYCSFFLAPNFRRSVKGAYSCCFLETFGTPLHLSRQSHTHLLTLPLGVGCGLIGLARPGKMACLAVPTKYSGNQF